VWGDSVVWSSINPFAESLSIAGDN
jgi:hypothetical protein